MGVNLTTAPAWCLFTLIAYGMSVWAYKRSNQHLMCLPVLTGTGLVVMALALTQVDYRVYAEATRVLRWLTGPAIIALAVPLYRQLPLLRRMALPLLLALLAGCLVSVFGTLALAFALDTPAAVAISLAPKSATMPIAMMAAERAGGVPAIAAMAVVAAGVMGTLMTPPLLRVLKLDEPVVRSFTLGLVAHAIGTARVLQDDPPTVAYAALAMGMNGLSTACLMAVLARWA